MAKTLTDEHKRNIGNAGRGKNKGRKHTPESIEKMKVALKGKVPWNKGLKGMQIPTAETRLKMSKARERFVITPEFRTAVSNGLKGKQKSEAHKKALSVAMRGVGHPQSNESKQKIRERHLGVPKSDSHKRNMSIAMKEKIRTDEEYHNKIKVMNIGRIATQATREKLSILHRGEKCHLYRGGISENPYAIEFNGPLRRKVRVRWNNVCASPGCGITKIHQATEYYPGGIELHVHHIDGDKDNYDEKNLIPFCFVHHIMNHPKGKDTPIVINQERNTKWVLDKLKENDGEGSILIPS